MDEDEIYKEENCLETEGRLKNAKYSNDVNLDDEEFINDFKIFQDNFLNQKEILVFDFIEKCIEFVDGNSDGATLLIDQDFVNFVNSSFMVFSSATALSFFKLFEKLSASNKENCQAVVNANSIPFFLDILTHSKTVTIICYVLRILGSAAHFNLQCVFNTEVTEIIRNISCEVETGKSERMINFCEINLDDPTRILTDTIFCVSKFLLSIYDIDQQKDFFMKYLLNNSFRIEEGLKIILSTLSNISLQEPSYLMIVMKEQVNFVEGLMVNIHNTFYPSFNPDSNLFILDRRNLTLAAHILSQITKYADFKFFKRLLRKGVVNVAIDYVKNEYYIDYVVYLLSVIIDRAPEYLELFYQENIIHDLLVLIGKEDFPAVFHGALAFLFGIVFKNCQQSEAINFFPSVEILEYVLETMQSLTPSLGVQILKGLMELLSNDDLSETVAEVLINQQIFENPDDAWSDNERLHKYIVKIHDLLYEEEPENEYKRCFIKCLNKVLIVGLFRFFLFLEMQQDFLIRKRQEKDVLLIFFEFSLFDLIHLKSNIIFDGLGTFLIQCLLPFIQLRTYKKLEER